eukprot:TRINITY_DN6778_c0_g2_i3.p1 TRINITY_DN6778_c0_g2~~TRINITY_DN6778_c0_g2_i3.p1  ORF type:complete len:186 (-),score=15.41 TRINITY_DN6778_c0_g2_i3:281-838(-)
MIMAKSTKKKEKNLTDSADSSKTIFLCKSIKPSMLLENKLLMSNSISLLTSTTTNLNPSTLVSRKEKILLPANAQEKSKFWMIHQKRLIGQVKLLHLLKIKDNVDHAGLSQLAELSKDSMLFLIVKLLILLLNNLLIVLEDLMKIKAAMVEIWLMPFGISLIMELPWNQNILIRQKIKNVLIKIP